MKTITGLTIFILIAGSTGSKGERHGRSLQVNNNRCLDKFAAIPGHTMCLPYSGHTPQNESQRENITSIHNRLRGNVSPTSADMLKMAYSKDLETEAQIWAEQCIQGHDSNDHRFQPGMFVVGQNLAVNGAEMSWSEVIQLWYDEVKDFTYDGQNEFGRVGHYTQVVWAQTALVGCGAARCGSKYHYVCNYGPSGNNGALGKPYQKGPACSNCNSCTSNLCDCGGKVCLNGGQLNVTTCQCTCNNKVHQYASDDCKLYCVDKGDNPLCGRTPFDKPSCPSNPFASYNCPKLCDICPYAGANYTEGTVALPEPDNSLAVRASATLTSLVLCLLAVRQ